ncbi:efflux RND transporter periplasmic adaptor subunit [Macromonas nakdongensis]|uniref:efflux RND transporter periplasmic adaptor subunit n=1 Tax=Macromonas nakdongensis TaxID=1843082 RepID=UPI0012FEF3B9|nr:efflux RND transporter periplasmic adaptor subunit [Macromonas nakdongensis]
MNVNRCFLAGLTVLAWPGGVGAAPFECLLEPAQTVEIRSAVEGLVRRIHVQRGDDVRAGQVLVELDASVERSSAAVAQYRAQAEGRIAASRNRMQYAQRKTQRSNELHQQSFISAQARDEAETEHNLAESELKEAMENRELARLEYQRAVDQLNQKTLRSPFNGIVVDRMLNPGDLAEAGNGRKPILKLAQIHPLRVEAVLPLSTFGKLRPGMVGQVTPEGGAPQKATIKVVDRVLDAASGTYGVRLELPNPQGQLPGGIRCQVEFSEVGGGGPVAARVR